MIFNLNIVDIRIIDVEVVKYSVEDFFVFFDIKIIFFYL